MFLFKPFGKDEGTVNASQNSCALKDPPDNEAPATNTNEQQSSMQLAVSRRRTWQAAFDSTCMERHTLHASIRDVFVDNDVDEKDVPEGSQVILWTDEKAKEKLVQKFRDQISSDQVENSIKEAPKSSAVSFVTSIVSTTWRVAYSTSKVFWQSNDDYLNEKYGITEDSDKEDHEEDEHLVKVIINESEPIINADLALECLHFLRNAIPRYGGEQEGIVALPGGPTTAPIACQEWIGRVLANDLVGSRRLLDFLRHMEARDLQFLLQVLIECGVIEILKRRPQQEDLLILGRGKDAAARDYSVAIYDLTKQIDAIQKRVDKLTKGVETCKRKAFQFSRNKQKAQAMQQMKLMKKFDHEISICEGTIHNLEAQKIAMESAANTKDILTITQQTANVLKDARKDLQNPDDTIMDVEDEFDVWREIQESIGYTNDPANQYDENELIAELEALSVDETPTSPALLPPVDKLEPPATALSTENIENTETKQAEASESNTDNPTPTPEAAT